MKRSWIAKEDIDMDLPTVDESVGEIPSETVEAVYAEIEEVDSQLEKMFDDGNELNNDTDKVGKLVETTEATLEENGMSDSAAEMVAIATESYCRRWGVKAPSIAVEAFDAGNNKLATEIAVEGLKDTYKSLVSRYYDWAIGLKTTIIKKINSYSKLADAITKRLAKIEGQLNSYNEEATIKVTQDGIYLANKLNVENAIKSVDTIVSNTSKAISALTPKLNELGKFIAVSDKDGNHRKVDEGQGFYLGMVMLLLGPYATAFAYAMTDMSAVKQMPKGTSDHKLFEIGSTIIGTYVHKDEIKVIVEKVKNDHVSRKVADLKLIKKAISALRNYATQLRGNELSNAVDKHLDIETLNKSLESNSQAVKDAKSNNEDVAAAKSQLALARRAYTIATHMASGVISAADRQARDLLSYTEACVKAK